MVDVEKIKQLCKENGTSIKKIEKELGIGNGVIARWSKSNPNYERLSKVAKYFNVSVEYLIGTEEKAPTPEDERPIGLDDFTYAMYKESKELTEESKQRLLEMAQFFRQQQKKEKKD